MMELSGDSIRVVHPLFQEENGGSFPTSPLQFEIAEIPLSRARLLNQLWHSRLPVYKSGFCQNSKICFGAIYGGLFFATAIWTNPVARNLPQKTWLELRRFAISGDAPRYTATRMLSIMTRIIKKKFPEVLILISYQDIEAHSGTIYKAAGWKATNYHSGGSWNRPNSRNTYTGKPRTRPDLNKAIGHKIRWQKELSPV